MDSSNGGDPNPDGGVPPPKGYALSGKIMLTAIVVLFTAVLLILFLHLYLRWRVLRRTSSGRRRRRRRLVFAGEEQSFPSPADRGLAADVLKSLPVFVFSVRGGGGGDGDEAVECAVCLTEFEEGEKVRSLPRCGHRFHIECIDMWFQSHVTCPLCRTAVEAAPPPNSTVSVEVLASEPAAAAVERSTSASNLCSRCGEEEGIGSSSANLGCPDLRIDVPPRRGDGFRGSEEELGLGLGLGSPGAQGMKSPGSRLLLLRRLLSRDLRLYRGGSSGVEPDLERQEGAERSSPRPRSPSRPPPPATAV